MKTVKLGGILSGDVFKGEHKYCFKLTFDTIEEAQSWKDKLEFTFKNLEYKVVKETGYFDGAAKK
jgi:hypothetical protein